MNPPNISIIAACAICLLFVFILNHCDMTVAPRSTDKEVKRLEAEIDSLKRNLQEYELTDWHKIDTVFIEREGTIVRVLRDSIDRVPQMSTDAKLLLWKKQVQP
jgi:hypothetical protein